MKDIKSMTPRELQVTRDKIDTLLSRRRKALTRARQKALAIARQLGLSVRDLFDGRKKGVEPARKVAEPVKRGPGRPRKVVEAEAPKRGPGRPRKDGNGQHAVH